MTLVQNTQADAATRPFSTVLVANRGEIAVRVIRTLHRLGIRSIAVASEADVSSVHARLADEVVVIGPAAASESYLDVERVIRAAIDTGAEAIHPGYGFLSENVELERACAAAGIVFVGPGERALEVMGDKIRSKLHVAASSVPVVPGVSEPGLDDVALIARARDVGVPMLIKPSAGGGGKGMQLVRDLAELPDALSTARRVARAAFGDDTLLIERFIEQPRHIEVQVLADAHGTVVHLGERECSLQRRHQKVIEEAPSPLLDAATRARIGRAACDAAASVAYLGAGTVEFLVSAARPDEFFFIEMNTRLQVEHPVTELVTGIDLVEQQLRLAAGEPLAFTQDDVRLEGHAIEARVYAESPDRGFLPSTGSIVAYREPDGEGVRVDSGVAAGSEVSAYYDPMIAKVIAHGADRAQALERLRAALADTVVLGVDTNLGFLQRLLDDPAVRAGDLDTGLIDRMPPPAALVPAPDALQAAARVVLDAQTEQPGAASALWLSRSGWRVGAHRERTVTFDHDGDLIDVRIPPPANAFLRSSVAESGASQEDTPLHAHQRAETPEKSTTTVARDSDSAVWVHLDGATTRLVPLDRAARLARSLAAIEREHGVAAPELRAPMPGSVTAIAVADGDHVDAGQTVLAIEAMKMEHRVTAPIAGVVRLAVAQGAQVRRDEIVAHVEPLTSETQTSEAQTSEAQTSEAQTSEAQTSETQTSEPQASEPQTSATQTSQPDTSALTPALTDPAASAHQAEPATTTHEEGTS